MQLENELNWPSSDILVGYDHEKNWVVYTAISTGEVLLAWDVAKDRKVEARDEVTLN